ncbi:MAG: FAD-dependent oxidoreductase, partial [Acidimicrobiales bacterium]
LMVAAGRRPNVEGLGLEALGVEVGARGIVVDNRMRTAVPWIYAAGDVAGRYLFTHSSAHEAVRAVRDMFFPGRGTVSDQVPWCTFTDPELAHVGMTTAEAREAFGAGATAWPIELAHSDRARADGAADGLVRVVTGPRNRIVGAHILAPSAGEMIHELALAMKERLRINELAGMIHVYPTLSTSIGQLAAEASFGVARRLGWLARTRWPW